MGINTSFHTAPASPVTRYLPRGGVLSLRRRTFTTLDEYFGSKPSVSKTVEEDCIRQNSPDSPTSSVDYTANYGAVVIILHPTNPVQLTVLLHAELENATPNRP